jgi:protein involved in polysaccharide export with SLBB domain
MKSPISPSKCLAALLLATLGACTSSPDKRALQYLNQEGYGRRYTGNSLQDDYLSIGDTLQFRDTYNLSVVGAPRIAIDGTIDFDQAGRVWVAGMTKEQAEVYLTEKLLAYYTTADVKVLLVPKPKTFWVLGEVGAPGQKPLIGDITLFDAVMLSIPSEHSANLGRVRLIRADPVVGLVLHANLSDMFSADSTFNLTIQEDDIIVVPPTMLAQLGYFISDLIFPFTEVLSSIFQGLLSVSKFSNLNSGNNKNNGVF